MTVRRELLNEAAALVDGERNVAYGNPNDDFSRTANYWSTHAGGVLRRKAFDLGIEVDQELLHIIDNLFSSFDVAIMMTQLKISRLAWSPAKKDHWVDGAGYMACGWDCVQHDDEPPF